MRANIMQSPKLHLSKYDKSRSNVVFTSYLPRFCYGGNSVFSSSVTYYLNNYTGLAKSKEFACLDTTYLFFMGLIFLFRFS